MRVENKLGEISTFLLCFRCRLPMAHAAADIIISRAYKTSCDCTNPQRTPTKSTRFFTKHKNLDAPKKSSLSTEKLEYHHWVHMCEDSPKATRLVGSLEAMFKCDGVLPVCEPSLSRFHNTQNLVSDARVMTPAENVKTPQLGQGFDLGTLFLNPHCCILGGLNTKRDLGSSEQNVSVRQACFVRSEYHRSFQKCFLEQSAAK